MSHPVPTQWFEGRDRKQPFWHSVDKPTVDATLNDVNHHTPMNTMAYRIDTGFYSADSHDEFLLQYCTDHVLQHGFVPKNTVSRFGGGEFRAQGMLTMLTLSDGHLQTSQTSIQDHATLLHRSTPSRDLEFRNDPKRIQAPQASMPISSASMVPARGGRLHKAGGLTPIVEDRTRLGANEEILGYQHHPTPVTTAFTMAGTRPSDAKEKGAILQLDDWYKRPQISDDVTVAEESSLDGQDREERQAMANLEAIEARVKDLQIEGLQRQGHDPIRSFQPSYKLQQRDGLVPGLDLFRSTISYAGYGHSRNYLGDMTIAHPRYAHVTEDQNCATWMTGLPTATDYDSLLGSIRNFGKVSSCFINRAGGKSKHCAAKVVFFERSQAQKLIQQSNFGEFSILGKKITTVQWNRNKIGRHTRLNESRVVRITAPEFMSVGWFEEFFNSGCFTYELEGTVEVQCADPGGATHEWRFGSVLQAKWAKMAIEGEIQVASVKWARDPCS